MERDAPGIGRADECRSQAVQEIIAANTKGSQKQYDYNVGHEAWSNSLKRLKPSTIG